MSDIQEKILELMDLFDDDEVTTADKINRPEPKQSVKEIELFNEFNIRNPKADGGRIKFQEAGSVNKIEDDILTKIKEKFPDYDEKVNKYGFPKKDPRYSKVRTMYRTLTGAFKAIDEKRKTNPERIKYKKEYTQRPEVKEKTLENQRRYYKDPIKRERILARNRKFITQPEQQKKRREYMKKRYYEGGQREKDLERLKKVTISKKASGYLQNPDNILLKDMIRAAEQNPGSGLKTIRGGPKNSIIAVQEGNKIYHAVGPKRKPVPGAPKNSIPITKHPSFKKRFEFVKQQKQFSNTKIPGTNTTYGKALDMLESKKAGTPLQNKNPAEFEHVKGVATDYKKGQVALRTANRGKQTILSALKNKNITKTQADKELKKIGVRGFVDGKYIGAPKINPEKQFNDLKKYVDRSVKKGSLKVDAAEMSLTQNLGQLGCPTKKFQLGGRVNFSNGSTCVLKGKQKLENIILKGGAKGKELDLAKTILRAGRGLKNMASIRGLLGPAALAFTVGTEAGLVGYDMLSKGETLRESFGNSLFNYALGKDYQIDPQEELFKRFKGLGYDDQQIGSIKRAFDTLNTINTGKNLVTDFEQQFTDNVVSRGQPEEFMMDEDQFISDTAGQRAEQNLKDAQERLISFNQSLKEVDRPGGMKKEDVLNEYFSSGKYAEDLKLATQAEKEANLQKLTSAGPKFLGSVFPKFEQQRQIDINKNLGVLVNPAFDIPGMKESTGGFLYGFADGGLSGGDKSGPPPESGPTPHGLPGILKRAKNI